MTSQNDQKSTKRGSWEVPGGARAPSGSLPGGFSKLIFGILRRFWELHWHPFCVHGAFDFRFIFWMRVPDGRWRAKVHGGRTRGGQAGEGDSLSGTSLERIGAVTKPYAKRQAFGLARRIQCASAVPATVPFAFVHKSVAQSQLFAFQTALPTSFRSTDFQNAHFTQLMKGIARARCLTIPLCSEVSEMSKYRQSQRCHRKRQFPRSK